MAYTIQRLSIVRSPIINRFKSKNSAWRTIFLIVVIGMILNVWVLFLYEIQTVNNHQICTVKNIWSKSYKQINFAFLVLIMLIPILIIITCNFIIINKTMNAESKRKSLQIKSRIKNSTSLNRSSFISNSIVSSDHFSIDEKQKINDYKAAFQRTISDDYDNNKLKGSWTRPDKLKTTFLINPKRNSINLNSFKLKPYYIGVNQATNRGSGKSINAKKITKTLVLISFSYALFNLSYFICLCLYYYDHFYNDFDRVWENYLLGAVEITEIFYILNYSMIFYIYCASGSLFRNQLKYSSSFNFLDTVSIDVILSYTET